MLPIRAGWLGLGTMGSGMARCLLKAGVALTVHDPDAERQQGFLDKAVHLNGAARSTGAASCDEVVRDSGGIIILSLPHSDAVTSVVIDHLSSMVAPGLIIDTSTTTPECAESCAAFLAGFGHSFLAAPVSGEQSRAEEGTLTVIASGPRATFDSALPVLSCLGHSVFVGESMGGAQLAKALNNALYNVSVAAMAEVLPLAQRSGLAPEVLLEVVASGTGQSFGFNKFAPLVLQRAFEAPAHGYPMAHAFKDMEVVATAARGCGASLPVVDAATATYRSALAMKLGGQHKGAMVKVHEARLGLQVGAVRTS